MIFTYIQLIVGIAIVVVCLASITNSRFSDALFSSRWAYIALILSAMFTLIPGSWV